MDRFDTKYQLPINKLQQILTAIKTDYCILEVNQNVIQSYQSIYFDTYNNDFYLNHHNGKASRIKIRKRQYVNSNLSFLEIKTKNNKGKTIKNRIQIYNFNPELNEQEIDFINSCSKSFQISGDNNLYARNNNKFNRITLVNPINQERCTIDLNLSFYSDNKIVSIKNMALIELKQERQTAPSSIKTELRKHHILPQRFSKYCVGRVLLDADLKHNLFKSTMTQIIKHFQPIENHHHINHHSIAI